MSEDRIAGAVGRLNLPLRAPPTATERDLSIARKPSNHAPPTVLELLRKLGHRTLEVRPDVIDGVAVWSATVRSVRRVVRQSSSPDLGALLLGVLDWARDGFKETGTSYP